MVTRADVRAYWSRSDNEKIRRSASHLELPPDRADLVFIREFLGPEFRGKKVLDVGAGPGRFVPIWAEFGVDLTCIDWSDTFFRILERRCAKTGARAFQMDITAEKLDEQFDLVFCTQLLMHIQPEYLDAALANIRDMMADKLCVFTQPLRTVQHASGDQISGFAHDYRTRFRRAGLRIERNQKTVMLKGSGKQVHNRMFYLSRARPSYWRRVIQPECSRYIRALRLRAGAH